MGTNWLLSSTSDSFNFFSKKFFKLSNPGVCYRRQRRRFSNIFVGYVMQNNVTVLVAGSCNSTFVTQNFVTLSNCCIFVFILWESASDHYQVCIDSRKDRKKCIFLFLCHNAQTNSSFPSICQWIGYYFSVQFCAALEREKVRTSWKPLSPEVQLLCGPVISYLFSCYHRKEK